MNGERVNMVRRSVVSCVNCISQLMCVLEFIAAEVNTVSVGENQVLPTLLNSLRRKI
nr:hypothetical protein [Candidatus Enterovibrio escacola]